MIVLIFKKTIVFSFNLHVRRAVAAHGDFVRYRRSAAPGAAGQLTSAAAAARAAWPPRATRPGPHAGRRGLLL